MYNKNGLKICFIISLIVLAITSCNEKQPDLGTKLIETILQSDTSYNDYLILDYYQGRFNQELHSDTLVILLNGLMIGKILNSDDSTLFKNADNDTVEFYNYESKLSLSNINVSQLDSSIIIKDDSVPGVKDAHLKSYFQIKWSVLTDEYKGFISFSLPIVNKRGYGMIAQTVYEKDGYKVIIYSYELDNLQDLSIIFCYKFRPLTYHVDFENGKIKNIKPEVIILDGDCSNNTTTNTQ